MPIDKMVLMELQIVGTLGMQSTRYPGMLQMVEAKKLNPKAMIPAQSGSTASRKSRGDEQVPERWRHDDQQLQ